MCVIAALEPSGLAGWLLVILQVAIGLGTVIFVHELGHFAVAKMCGVKCEKFFIGFDIGGYKISRKWGETEYGIGILPLGGYVKMLGQDDNPANIAEQVRESEVQNGQVDAKEIKGPDGKTYLVDRRSYLAKSVPQRMAIISAGVVMNVIFAFIFAVIAFGLGVPYVPSIVAQTSPGSPAWQAGMRPGDEIVRIGDKQDPSFTDLRGSVSLADLERGVSVAVKRGSVVRDFTLKPVQEGSNLAQIGIAPPHSLRLLSEQPAFSGSPAAELKEGFVGDDEIVAVNGEAIENYGQFTSILAQNLRETLKVTVVRGGAPPKEDPYGNIVGGERVDIELPPSPMRRLGLKMHMGKVAAVQQGSPAAAEDVQIRAGDFIEQIDDSAESTAKEDDPLAHWDPIVLPQILQRMAEDYRDVQLTLRRSGPRTGDAEISDKPVVNLDRVQWLEEPLSADDPVPAPAIGVAYKVLNVVDSVELGSPAAKAGIQSRDVLTVAEFIYPDDLEVKPETKPVVFTPADESASANNWAGFLAMLQIQPEGTRVKLKYKRGDAITEVEMTPELSPDVYNAKRGLIFERMQRIRKANSLQQQVQLGWDETANSLGLVYRFLSKLGGQVPLTMLGGPITIAQAAGYSAVDGMGKLLVFLTMLSANLAVINFLPIPLLDGGHMVFLVYEGIRGRPAGEKFVVAMHTVGFVFIISLMLFVISLDVRRLLGFA